MHCDDRYLEYELTRLENASYSALRTIYAATTHSLMVSYRDLMRGYVEFETWGGRKVRHTLSYASVAFRLELYARLVWIKLYAEFQLIKRFGDDEAQASKKSRNRGTTPQRNGKK